jgi:hypothetical protein
LEHVLLPNLPLRSQTKRILATVLFAVAWGGAVTWGVRAMAAYENKPGSVGKIAAEWPSLKLERAKDRATLVLVAHPQCPCTQATMTELAGIMAEAQGKIAAYVLFVTPHDAPADWEQTNLRRSAAAIPGVTAVTDVDGIESQLFGGETSGYTLLFSAEGRLLFSGGITASRGHEGENAGESAIVALARGEKPVVTKTLVFGCPTEDRVVSNGKGTFSR